MMQNDCSKLLNRYYEFSRPDIQNMVPINAERILDVGCAGGILGKTLKKRGTKEVVGIEINQEVADVAKQRLDRVIVGDVENLKLPFKNGYFDCIIFADVLEHLRDPWNLLKRYRNYLSDEGVIVSSIPNVQHLEVINNLINGRWDYTSAGILDKTHLRFFTLDGIQKMFDENRFKITTLNGILSPEYEKIKNASPEKIEFGHVSINIKNLTETMVKMLFVIQYLITAQKI